MLNATVLVLNRSYLPIHVTSARRAFALVYRDVARVVNEAFDDLDAPVARVGARDGISPQAESLEKAFLPNPDDISTAIRGLI